MTDETYLYSKQEKLFNPEKTQPKCYIYGCGSGGSHITIGLAKIGIKNITVYDYDTVEETNVPAQFFTLTSAKEKQLKTEAIKRLAKEMTGTNINTVTLKIDDTFNPEITSNSIHILAVDSIEIRKLLANKLKDYPVFVIDGRIGGFNYEKYSLRADSDNFDKYLKTLEGTFAETPCGEKCLWANNTLIASKIIADVIKISQNKTPTEVVKGNLLSDMVIEGKLK